jgi:hypothetical protein
MNSAIVDNKINNQNGRGAKHQDGGFRKQSERLQWE